MRTSSGMWCGLVVFASWACSSSDSDRAETSGSGGAGSQAGSAGIGDGATGSGGAANGGGGAATGGSGGAGGSAGSGNACGEGVAGPRSTSFTPSGPIDATTGSTYEGLRIENPDGPCITLNGASNVTIRDSELGPCGGGAAIIVSDSTDVTIEQIYVHDSPRGVLAQSSNAITTRGSRFDDIDGQFPEGTAIEYDYMENGGVIAENCIQGTFGSDVISGFESSNLQIVGNEIHATITLPSAAGFTIGDSVDGAPGHDNYVAYNQVFQVDGVPPGVFGSSGNTVLEYNCLPTGIQAYAYNDAPFVGVTIENNIIGPGSFVPEPSVVNGWRNNTFTREGAGCD